MNTLVKDAKAPVALHRRLIVDTSFKHYDTPEQISAHASEEGRMAERDGVIAHLFRKRTRASDEEAMKALGLTGPLLLLCRGKVEYALREETRAKMKPVSAAVAAIEAAVEEALAVKEVKSPDTAPTETDPSHVEKIFEAVIAAAKHAEVTRASLRTNVKTTPVQRARNVVILLLAAEAGLGSKAVGHLLDKTSAYVERALGAMIEPTDSHKHLIHSSCHKLGIDEETVYAWCRRTPRPAL